MKKFERIVMFLMVIPVMMFTIETLAANQTEVMNFDVSLLKPTYLSTKKMKDYNSWQKYWNNSFMNISTGKQGALDVRMIELYSQNPDPDSLNYHSAWYALGEGETEPFYGPHFNYAGGLFKVEIRNHSNSLNTYHESGIWYISY